jgi:hypothetical protein
MRKFLVLLLVTACCLTAGHRAQAAPQGDDNRLEQALGILEYTSRPEISICFCGSFYLIGEKGVISNYLISDEIDLTQYIGKKVFVTGKPFTGVCEGTLALPCDYLLVEEIVLKSSTATADSDWGSIKLYYK